MKEVKIGTMAPVCFTSSQVFDQSWFWLRYEDLPQRIFCKQDCEIKIIKDQNKKTQKNRKKSNIYLRYIKRS